MQSDRKDKDIPLVLLIMYIKTKTLNVTFSDGKM